jgi:hypothetical protein
VAEIGEVLVRMGPVVQEVVVRAKDFWKFPLKLLCTAGLLFLLPVPGRGQEAPKSPPTNPPPADASADVQALAQAVRELQGQVQVLHAQMSQLRAEEQQAHDEARNLRRELRLAQTQPPSFVAASYENPGSLVAPEPVAPAPQDGNASAPAPDPAVAGRLDKLEENQELTDGKLNDQYQTKVESGSKYKLKLSGIVLFNMFSDRGSVDNQDFPAVALEPGPLDSAGTFGASLRQSQIGLDAFGPDIAGAHTSANVVFDFAGGFPDTPNGVATGIVRLRTGIIRFDWGNTSIIAGQDQLFFAPLTPTSLASLALPALAYAGNLWSWTPQIRVEHRVHVSESSTLTFQGGILDNFTGEEPAYDSYRTALAGEKSAQPAYATRTAWSHDLFGEQMTIGVGGYYSRQNWGFGRYVDGWAGTTDFTLPLGRFFEFTQEFYRGRAVGGIGGGIDQTVLASGDLTDPASVVQGLNSVGGWAQLKFKPRPKFEVNGAFGHDNPFGNQVARFADYPAYYDSLFARNQVWFTNGIYQPRSDVMLSLEFRRLRTFGSDGGADVANQVSLSLGYLF